MGSSAQEKIICFKKLCFHAVIENEIVKMCPFISLQLIKYSGDFLWIIHKFRVFLSCFSSDTIFVNSPILGVKFNKQLDTPFKKPIKLWFNKLKVCSLLLFNY